MTSWYDKSLFSQIQFQFAHWANKKPHISNFKCYVVVECMHCVPKVKDSNQPNNILISAKLLSNRLLELLLKIWYHDYETYCYISYNFKVLSL